MASQTIGMNDFVRQWGDAGEDVMAATRRVGESGWYVLGKEVREFEAALHAHLGFEHAVGCASGLDAIELGLRALGLAAGQKVLTTPLSAFATTLAIIRAGGVPVFVDVDESGALDLDLAAACLAADPSIRFCVPVHLFGHAMDHDALTELTRRFDLALVEDCCQAIGARSCGKPVGSVGRAAALSFYPTKNLGALGDGGAVLTNDEDVAAQCRSLRDYGQSAKYQHTMLGLNSRLDELHAAILHHAHLSRLDAWTSRRREIAQQYLAGLANPRVTPVPVPARGESVWHLFPVTVDPADRDGLMAHLRGLGVGSGIHYPTLINEQSALASTPFEVFGPLPRAERMARAELSLPIHPYLTDVEVARVVDAVNGFRGG